MIMLFNIFHLNVYFARILIREFLSNYSSYELINRDFNLHQRVYDVIMIVRSVISILFSVSLFAFGVTSKTGEDGETGYETGKQSDRGFAEKKIRCSRHRCDTSHVQVSSTCNAVLAVPLSYPSGPFPPSAAAVSRATSARTPRNARPFSRSIA